MYALSHYVIMMTGKEPQISDLREVGAYMKRDMYLTSKKFRSSLGTRQIGQDAQERVAL